MSKILVFSISIVLLLSISCCPQSYGGWTSAAPMNIPRQYHASIKLPDGSILVTGGLDMGPSYLNSCEIYNYKTNTWTFAANMNIRRGIHQMVVLDSNRVLAIGGFETRSCEIYNIKENKWSIADSLKILRDFGWTATLLNNGKVLVTGGHVFSTDLKNSYFLSNVEIYDPALNKWSEIDGLKIKRKDHTATLLNNGKVLIVGGENNEKELNDCEIFDPITEEWSVVDSSNIRRFNHSAIILANGDVLISGGLNYLDSTGPWLNSCEIYNPVENNWTIVTPMLSARDMHFSIKLSNSYILFAGGEYAQTTWELYEPKSFKNICLGDYPTRQSTPQIQLLNNDNVISIGGFTWTESNVPVLSPTALCEIYSSTIAAIENKTNNSIKTFELLQNYPNPFNPTTTINYKLNKPGYVKIIVYNIFGEVVKKLLESYKNEGSYSVKFDGTNLSSGIYFYTLSINSNEVTMKMILLQ